LIRRLKLFSHNLDLFSLRELPYRRRDDAVITLSSARSLRNNMQAQGWSRAFSRQKPLQIAGLPEEISQTLQPRLCGAL
jgi:hypothetical protein